MHSSGFSKAVLGTAEGLTPGHGGVICGKRMGWESRQADGSEEQQRTWPYLFVAIQEHVEGRVVVTHRRIKTCCLRFHCGGD